MSTYGQFCPAARATEVLDERWTLLVVRRETVGADASYTLTESGRDLNEIVTALGVWGTRGIGELGDKDLDPHLLMWVGQGQISTVSH
jgi:DNA-binding HxlR family transcriptional regulator